jgi:CBS domain containing-hemolysin-like protein
MTTLLLFFILSISFSFLCSIWEAVLLSITPSYINTRIQEGDDIGASLKEFKEDIDKPLSAILTLNTIAHTVGAIGVGAQAGALFGDSDFSIGPLNIESIIAVFMTLAILILSEIIPKTLGANYWRKLTPFTIFCIKWLMIILAPLVWVSQLITKNLKSDKDKSVFSRADFRAMAQAGEESGVLKSSESITIKNLLKLDSLTVSDIMTPRSVILSAIENMSLRDYYDKNAPLKHSRIPVFDSQKEHVIGVLLKDNLLEALLAGQGEASLNSLIRPVMTMNQKDNLAKLQKELMKSKMHLAIVVDDFGAVLGLVTMEDLFETILGLEIVDESDEDVDLQKKARELWEKRTQDLNALK